MRDLTVCGVDRPAWTTYLTHPHPQGYNTAGRISPPSLVHVRDPWGEGCGWLAGGLAKALAVSVAYPGPPSAGQSWVDPSRIRFYLGRKQVYLRLLYVATYSCPLSLFLSPNPLGLGEAVGGVEGGGGGHHAAGPEGLFFPRKGERVRRGVRAGSKPGAAAFSEYVFQKEFQPSGTPARAFLKMVWFLDTKRSFSGPEPCNLGVCG